MVCPVHHTKDLNRCMLTGPGNYTALHFAASRGFLDAVCLLIERGIAFVFSLKSIPSSDNTDGSVASVLPFCRRDRWHPNSDTTAVRAHGRHDVML